ncbi:MAG: Dam family site-specific DNA-(adenine-N6)-methyltransferase [Deferribacteraceae bacterium]|jgi:DNA adenine methylase|nr:Dam family site-specific DNA-(adenine-N6)-methyltransferase [Deferribacteraceae bacterium]
MNIIIPPIKCQGIKSKLVAWIYQKVPNNYDIWYEPFMGSGVVGFNIQPKKAVFSDTNPHLINFYNDIKNGIINHEKVKQFLVYEGEKLFELGEHYYKQVRERFNEKPNTLDFLFLNRSCFNGMIRFNGKGGFNVPFCKKPNRFAQAYITKITNQVKNISVLIQLNDWSFVCDSCENIIIKATPTDLIYCDPPYIDRYSDYFNSWTESNEQRLFEILSKKKARFILSTWHHNKYRHNKYIDLLWNKFNVDTKNHFYHLGASENNRSEVIEALITNFQTLKNYQSDYNLVVQNIDQFLHSS